MSLVHLCCHHTSPLQLPTRRRYTNAFIVSASISVSIIEHKRSWNRVVAYPICRSVGLESVLWQNGWLDPVAISGSYWGRSVCIRLGWRSFRRWIFGDPFIVTNGIATRSSQITMGRTCYYDKSSASARTHVLSARLLSLHLVGVCFSLFL